MTEELDTDTIAAIFSEAPGGGTEIVPHTDHGDNHNDHFDDAELD